MLLCEPMPAACMTLCACAHRRAVQRSSAVRELHLWWRPCSGQQGWEANPTSSGVPHSGPMQGGCCCHGHAVRRMAHTTEPDPARRVHDRAHVHAAHAPRLVQQQALPQAGWVDEHKGPWRTACEGLGSPHQHEQSQPPPSGCPLRACRSQFVQVFGNSPDETAYFRLMLFRVSVPDAMVRVLQQQQQHHQRQQQLRVHTQAMSSA